MIINLKNILNSSTYTLQLFVDTSDLIYNLHKFELYIKNQSTLINESKTLILSYNDNSNGDIELSEQLESIINRYINKDIPREIIHLKNNKGHVFGTYELDYTSLKESIKYTKNKYIIKSSIDMVFNFKTLEDKLIDLKEGLSMWYLPSYTALNLFEHEINNMQTNFYIIDREYVEKFENELDNQYKYVIDIMDIHIKSKSKEQPWFLYKTQRNNKFDNEHLLDEFTDKIDNRICLLSEKEQNILKKFVIKFNVGDPSHKDLFIGGFCHLHNIRAPINIIKYI